MRSDDINEHLKELADAGFSAKDFRTWNATVLAAVALSRHDPKDLSRTARRRAIDRELNGTEPGEFPDRERIEKAVLRLLR